MPIHLTDIHPMWTFIHAFLLFVLLWFVAGEIQARFKITSKAVRFWLPVNSGFSWIPFLILLPRDDDKFSPADLEHERRHETQREEDGYIRWSFRYITDGRELTRYEAEAYAFHAREWLDRDDIAVSSVEKATDAVMRSFYGNSLYWFWPWLEKPPEGYVRRQVETEIKELINA